MKQTNSFDVVVVGGGAAGLFCASKLGHKGKRVAVLERSNKVGKKILMSGGGRCNFTNMYVEPEHYVSANPHFCKSALSRYSQWDFIALVAQYGIPYHEKKLGQLFCDRSAKDILSMLLQECAASQVDIRTLCEILSVTHNGRFSLETNMGGFTADALVIATGGLSIPTMGSTGFGYQIAEQFGLSVLPTRAGLVPFTCSGDLKQLCTTLSGISVASEIASHSAQFAENILFTHRGLSGPAVLQLSSYWHEGESVSIDLVPNQDMSDWLIKMKTDQPNTMMRTALTKQLPKKLVLELEKRWWSDYADITMGQWTDQRLTEIGQRLNEWRIKPSGTEGYRTAEVTLGGVDTAGLSSKTLESKTQRGLFFVGEVIDVTGHLGGFNFQWAWSSAHAVAESI